MIKWTPPIYNGIAIAENKRVHFKINKAKSSDAKYRLRMNKVDKCKNQ